MLIEINHIIEQTKVEGPGQRYCIYVQGCSLRCDGCANRALWDRGKGYLIDTSRITKQIYQLRDVIDGITFLGGEPLDQIEAVNFLAAEVKRMGLTVVIFTGYLYSDLISRNNVHLESLLKNTDILIDGPYIKSLTDNSRPWVGSSNQNYYFLSDYYLGLKSKLYDIKNKFEIRILPNGLVQINGMGNYFNLLEKLDFCTMSN